MCVWSCPNLCKSMTLALQAPLSMGFPRQEYWSGLPFPCSGSVFFMSPKSCLLSFWNWNVAPVKKCLFWFFFFPREDLEKWAWALRTLSSERKIYFKNGDLEYVFTLFLYFKKYTLLVGICLVKNIFAPQIFLILVYYDILGPSGFLSPCTWSSVGNSPFKGFQG